MKLSKAKNNISLRKNLTWYQSWVEEKLMRSPLRRKLLWKKEKMKET